MSYTYIESNSCDPYFNFGLELYLAREKRLAAETVLLFWRTEPCLMLGRYQNIWRELNWQVVRDEGILLVRRLSGGGCIFTDLGGWQFSFIAAQSERSPNLPQYAAPIVQALRNLGCPCEFNGRNDITVEGKKFSGNAQYWSKGFLVHHGSLLFAEDLDLLARASRPSPGKLESKGLSSVRARVVNLQDYLPQGLTALDFKAALLAELNPQGKVLELRPEEIERVQCLAESEFAQPAKLYGKEPPYNLERQGHFAGGNLCLQLSVAAGRIQHFKLSGDFLGEVPEEELEQALRGLLLTESELAAKLAEIGFSDWIHGIKSADILQLLF